MHARPWGLGVIRGVSLSISLSVVSGLLVGCMPLQSNRARSLWDTYNPLGLVTA